MSNFDIDRIDKDPSGLQSDISTSLESRIKERINNRDFPIEHDEVNEDDSEQ